MAAGLQQHGHGPLDLDLKLLSQNAAHFNTIDEERKNFVDKILSTLYSQQAHIDELQIELDDQQRSRKVYQHEASQLKTEVTSLQRRLSKDPFVAVLIDGDGAKFQDALIQQTANGGGAEAAQRLKQAVRNYLRENNTSLDNEDVPIVVNIYANLGGLATALRYNGTIPNEAIFVSFVEQFNKSLAEFNFINVGRGKENADSKMRKMFRFYYKNVQCQKIFFAGCHDNGYIHELSEKRGEADADQRIVLVETTPAEIGFKQLNFPMVRFDDVFRSEPLNNENIKTGVKHLQHQPPSQLASAFGVSQPGAGPIQNGQASSSPLQLPAHPVASSASPQGSRPVPMLVTNGHASGDLAGAVLHSPTASHHTSNPSPPPDTPSSTAPSTENRPTNGQINKSANGGVSIRYPKDSSYATAGGDTNHQNIVLEPKTTKAGKPPRVLIYNSRGHRLDPPIEPPRNPLVQQSYQDKLKETYGKGFCNEWYINGYCPYGTTCTRDHSTVLSISELNVHRYRARTSACSNGPECMTYGCYLSHHCPQDPRCPRGSSCRFSAAMNRSGDLHLTSKEEMTPYEKWIEGNDEPIYLGPKVA